MADWNTGPGETQLEVDRREIGRRIEKLKRDLKVKLTRKINEKTIVHALPNRRHYGIHQHENQPYTTLTESNVLQENKLFATLTQQHES